MSKEPELLPCPFCSSTNIKFLRHRGISVPIQHRGHDVFSIDCYDCGASVPNRYDGDLIVLAWNTRPTYHQPDE